MADTPPIEPEYDVDEEARNILNARQDAAERLEAAVHPLAEAFVARFDDDPLTDHLSRAMLKFSGCVSEAAARRLFGSLLAGITHDTYLAMMTAFQLGVMAARAESRGELALPEEL